MCHLDYMAAAGSGKVGSAHRLTTPVGWSGVDVVQNVNPTDRPMSVQNRYVIGLFGGDFVLVLFPFDILLI